MDGETYENFRFHQKCLDRYVHPKALKRFEEDQNSEPEDDSVNKDTELRSSSRKRDRSGKIKLKLFPYQSELKIPLVDLKLTQLHRLHGVIKKVMKEKNVNV